MGLRWFLGIALLQLLTMWVAFTSFVVLQLYAAVFTDLYIDSPATSIVALIYLTPTLIPATTFLWGFCQHRRKIEETLRGKSLAV